MSLGSLLWINCASSAYNTTLPPDRDEVRSLVNNRNKIGPKIDP